MFKWINSGKGYWYAEHNNTIRKDELGVYGGGGGQPTTVVQAAPTTPAPDPGESSEALYQARLKYDPQVAAMEQNLAQQYLPQQSALQAALYQQYAPMVAQTQEDLRRQFAPEQTALTEQFAQQAQKRLASPWGETPEELAALEAGRQRQREDLTEQLRTRANLGGGLFGGRAASTEQQAQTELGQAFAQEDIARRQAGSETALRYAMPIMQQLYPQTQYPGQPQTSAYGVQQPVTPGADVLYQAMYGASQPQYFQSPLSAGGVNLGILGRWGGGAGY